MRENIDRFGDAQVVVVSFSDPARLLEYRTFLDVPFAFVADSDRRLYELLGAGRGTFRQVWALGTLRRYAALVARGGRLRRPTEDTAQLGADAVVGRDGRLRYLVLPASPHLRPPIDDLVAALD